MLTQKAERVQPPEKPKIVVILGQTATGKSDLGVLLAEKFGGEVVSADSRQVYRGLDIGTGKITRKEMRDIPHHLIDVASPKRVFTAADYRKLARQKIDGVIARGNIPFIVGGTGLYIDAALGSVSFPDVPPDPALRTRLEKKDTASLVALLKKNAPERARNTDSANRRRLIRALEIAVHAPAGAAKATVARQHYDVLKIGIAMNSETLKKRISARLSERMKRGMAAEAEKLHRAGVSWKRMEELGLEYRFLARHLQGKMTGDEMVQKLSSAIWQYARRQKTWFKRDTSIRWFTPSRAGKWSNADIKKIQEVVKDFLVS